MIEINNWGARQRRSTIASRGCGYALSLLLGLGTLLGSVQWTPAQAFGEDLCWLNEQWAPCALDPCPAGSGGTGCGSIAFLTTLASNVVGRNGARSSVHFDAVYYLAQAAGLSPRDAYFIAAYDQATDLGQFLFRAENGEMITDPALCDGLAPPESCALLTINIRGVDRNDFASGGLFFHFPALPQAAPNINGLNPAIGDLQSEPMLYNARRWVYGDGPLCVAGLATGADSCFVSSVRKNSTLLGYLPFASGLVVDTVSWVSVIEEQRLIEDPISGELHPASELAHYLPPQIVPLAKLGVFLHALQDRVSHQVCITQTQMIGPRSAALPIVLNPLPYTVYGSLQNVSSLQDTLDFLLSLQTLADPDFIVDLDRSQLLSLDDTECDQLDHASRHVWETGTDQTQLAPADQTLAAGLTVTLQQLREFATHHGIPAPNTATTPSDTQLIADLIAAISTPSAAARISAFNAPAQRYGWLPLPFANGGDLASWNAAAGTHHFAP